MKISIQKYAKALAKAVKNEEDKKVIAERMGNLLKILVKRKQSKLIKSFYEEFQKVWFKENKKIEVRLTLPSKPSEEEAKGISKSLGEALGKEVITNVVVDEKIIGGMKLEYEDYVIDGTIVKNLEMLKTALNTNN